MTHQLVVCAVYSLRPIARDKLGQFPDVVQQRARHHHIAIKGDIVPDVILFHLVEFQDAHLGHIGDVLDPTHVTALPVQSDRRDGNVFLVPTALLHGYAHGPLGSLSQLLILNFQKCGEQLLNIIQIHSHSSYYIRTIPQGAVHWFDHDLPPNI